MAILSILSKNKEKKKGKQPYSPTIEESLYIYSMDYFIAVNIYVSEDYYMVLSNAYNIL